jgi:hypothetical protein
MEVRRGDSIIGNSNSKLMLELMGKELEWRQVLKLLEERGK